MMVVKIEKITDEKFLIESWVAKKSGKFVFETLDDVITFIKEAYQAKEK